MNVHGGRCEMCFYGKHGQCEHGTSLARCGCHCMGPTPQAVLLQVMAGALAARQSEDPLTQRLGDMVTDYLLDQIPEQA